MNRSKYRAQLDYFDPKNSPSNVVPLCTFQTLCIRELLIGFDDNLIEEIE